MGRLYRACSRLDDNFPLLSYFSLLLVSESAPLSGAFLRAALSFLCVSRTFFTFCRPAPIFTGQFSRFLCSFLFRSALPIIPPSLFHPHALFFSPEGVVGFCTFHPQNFLVFYTVFTRLHSPPSFATGNLSARSPDVKSPIRHCLPSLPFADLVFRVGVFGALILPSPSVVFSAYVAGLSSGAPLFRPCLLLVFVSFVGMAKYSLPEGIYESAMCWRSLFYVPSPMLGALIYCFAHPSALEFPVV